jgi:hypothetical protein
VKITKEMAVSVETILTSSVLFMFFIIIGIEPTLEMYISMLFTYLAARLIIPKFTDKFVYEHETDKSEEE